MGNKFLFHGAMCLRVGIKMQYGNFLRRARGGLEISAMVKNELNANYKGGKNCIFRSKLLVMISGCMRERRGGGSIVACFHPAPEPL